jgi:Protein of unknown function (DUF4235)
VSRILFAPISILGGVLAGIVARKSFAGVWRVIDEEEPPDPKQRQVDGRKLLAALVLEGAIFRMVRGVVDHATRRGFSSLTGSWPGEKRPKRA